ncbi:MAG: hypothetical protein A2W58_01930 [Candidatus Zambryskibacteria bacterium RIFCSPHIGHO2_02_38_10.5]|uniref:Rod shape-determining protein MreC beta-barrel core domain-containing protein n=1 Tax=Candidatus Zambryskibacteria bacterium RIFCSPHIGHO2_02_38_10.5 TaxID=1802742 RepID=A0A1G2TBL9_9BACT|nr:MAG: hypothetical protein UT81_C0019G0013 [Parcubacteria group bacterium GW2011_GWA2_40_14]OHA94001.1 MAG: hypothetical protein A2W58_01930 [Candidatus Zambryskibacteria bacterium RIFCSPHIGHO2_02_38_10.5]
MKQFIFNKPKWSYPRKTIIVVSVFILLSLLAYLFPNILRNVSHGISRPLWSVSSTLSKSFTKIKNFFVLKTTLINQNLTLIDEISALKLKEIDYDILLKENEDLKNQFGRVSQSKRIIAAILSKPPRSPYDTLVIDAGERDAIGLGDKVYLSDTILIGIITSITPESSLVKLFSTSDYKQEAILFRTGTSFELVGRGGANLELLVPKDTDIIWGDIFMYPGLSTSVIASVYYIDTNSQSSFKTIYLRIPGNVFSTRFVFVEKRV